MARSLNKVQLIGNVTRDPELKYTSSGSAVVSFSLATNRSWTDGNGQKKEEAEFHRIVAWAKLAEIISQYVTKGAKIYIEGRIQSRKWTDQANIEHQVTEIIAEDMLMLDGRKDQ